MSTQMTCIVCPVGCRLQVEANAAAPNGYTITGNRCPRGHQYALDEMTNPKRVVTSTVPIAGGGYMPVRTREAIPRTLIDTALGIIRATTCPADARMDDVLVANIAGSGVDLIACQDCTH